MADVMKGSQEKFQEEVLASAFPVLVDFYATWCSHCTRLSPVLEELAAEMSGRLKVVKINVDENKELTKKYGVMSLPTMLLFKNGERIEKLMGYMPKEKIIDKVEPLL